MMQRRNFQPKDKSDGIKDMTKESNTEQGSRSKMTFSLGVKKVEDLREDESPAGFCFNLNK